MDTLLSKLRNLPESARRGIAWGVTAVVGAAGLYWWALQTRRTVSSMDARPVIQQFIPPR